MSADTGYRMLRRVLDQHQPQGWAIEFGVYTAHSLSIIAEHMPVIGLDSFDGLPEDWRPGFGKGKFATGGVLKYAQPFNSLLVRGLFHETLPGLVSRGLPEIGLVHIDCDLYSSTVTALHGIRTSLRPGTIVVFDEYHGYPGHEEHESKAWVEFCFDHEVRATQIDTDEQECAFRIDEIGGHG